MAISVGNIGAHEGVKVELNEQLVQQQARAFGQLMVDNPDTRKRIRKIIREELKDAAKRLREDFKLDLTDDPRKTYRGVKYGVYQQILGGNLSILNPRRAGVRTEYRRPRKLDEYPWQRGGNRRKRSADTERVDSYFGKDRAFILRFLSSGTKERKTRYGKRGSIAARNWFQNYGPAEMRLVAENLAEIIDDELVDAYNEMIKS